MSDQASQKSKSTRRESNMLPRKLPVFSPTSSQTLRRSNMAYGTPARNQTLPAESEDHSVNADPETDADGNVIIDPKKPIRGSSWFPGMMSQAIAASRTGNNSISVPSDFAFSFTNMYDLGFTDGVLIEQFKPSVPRRFHLLAVLLSSKLPWYKALMTEFKTDLQTKTGADLHESISRFVSICEDSLDSSPWTILNCLVDALTQFRKKTHIKEAGWLISKKTIKFLMFVCNCCDDQWQDVLISLSNGISPVFKKHNTRERTRPRRTIWEPESSDDSDSDDSNSGRHQSWRDQEAAKSQLPPLETPGFERFHPDNPESARNLQLTIAALIPYVVASKPQLIDTRSMRKALIIGDQINHSLMMNGTTDPETWIYTVDEMYTELVHSCNTAGTTNLIPTQEELADNLQIASTDKLWTQIEKRCEKDGILFSDLSYTEACQWFIKAQTDIDFRTHNRSIRTAHRQRSAKPDSEAAPPRKEKPKRPKPETRTESADPASSKNGSVQIDLAESKTAKAKIAKGSRPDGKTELDPEELAAVRKAMPCTNWQDRGSCERGDACRYSHAGPRGSAKKTVSEVVVASDSDSDDEVDPAPPRRKTKARPKKAVHITEHSQRSDSECDSFEIERPPTDGATIRWASDVKQHFMITVSNNSADSEFKCLTLFTTQNDTVLSRAQPKAAVQSLWDDVEYSKVVLGPNDSLRSKTPVVDSVLLTETRFPIQRGQTHRIGSYLGMPRQLDQYHCEQHVTVPTLIIPASTTSGRCADVIMLSPTRGAYHIPRPLSSTWNHECALPRTEIDMISPPAGQPHGLTGNEWLPMLQHPWSSLYIDDHMPAIPEDAAYFSDKSSQTDYSSDSTEESDDSIPDLIWAHEAVLPTQTDTSDYDSSDSEAPSIHHQLLNEQQLLTVTGPPTQPMTAMSRSDSELTENLVQGSARPEARMMGRSFGSIMTNGTSPMAPSSSTAPFANTTSSAAPASNTAPRAADPSRYTIYVIRSVTPAIISQIDSFDDIANPPAAILQPSHDTRTKRGAPDQDSDDDDSGSDDGHDQDDSMGQTEWETRLRNKYEPNSEIAKLMRGGATVFLDKKARAARNKPASEWKPKGSKEDEMVFMRDVGSERAAGLINSSFEFEESQSDSGSVSDEELKNSNWLKGQDTITSFFHTAKPAAPASDEDSESDEDDVEHHDLEIADNSQARPFGPENVQIGEFEVKNSEIKTLTERSVHIQDVTLLDVENSYGQVETDTERSLHIRGVTVPAVGDTQDPMRTATEAPGDFFYMSTNSDDNEPCSCSRKCFDMMCTRCLQCEACCDCEQQHERLLARSRLEHPELHLQLDFQ